MPPERDEQLTDFEIVWRDFPRKTAKAVARKAWRKLAPDTATVQKMIDALKWQKQTDQWQRGIIPHMSTWLNQERFDDEPFHVAPAGSKAPSVPTGTDKQRIAHEQITALVASGMDRKAAILKVENELWGPRVH